MYGVVERQVNLWPAFPENESRPHAKKPHVIISPHEEWLGFPEVNHALGDNPLAPSCPRSWRVSWMHILKPNTGSLSNRGS
jgi:hypothetical protein